MDRNILFDCLVAWVNTFNLSYKCENVNDFKDGMIIAKCLNNIDPEYFTEEWVSKIKSETNENWRLKLLNLKKILQTITDYYSEILNYSLTDFEMPNLNLIVESNNSSSNVEELSHLLQLVLGCAVNCERKNEFIKTIMEMSENTQHMIMTAIQDLMSKDRNANIVKSSNSSLSIGLNNDEDLNYQLKRALMEINRINELKDDIEQKCKRLDKQVSELQDEKMAILNEMDLLKSKLQREDMARTDPNSEHNKHVRLQQKLDQMQEELYKLESEKEKYRIQFEAAKAEQDLLIEKNIELKKLAAEHQSLKDEIDVLKHNCYKVEKLESAIDSYKIKLEEMTDLKKQMKLLEENNTKYLEKILYMEEEIKKIITLKSQIEMYKKQIQELHEQLLNDEMKQKKLEYEYKGIEEKYVNLKNEKERIQADYERIKEAYDQLNINAKVFEDSKIEITKETTDESTNQMMDGLFSSVELVNIPTEVKEKIIRLYHENKLLKTKQNDLTDERLIMVQTQYEDEKQRTLDLQTKLNETSKQKIELECQLNDLKKKETELASSLSLTSNNDQLIKTRDDLINDLKTKLSKSQIQFEDECKKNELMIKQLEEKIKLLSIEKDEFKDSKDKEIQLKDKEISDLNEKYRVYLEKAKIVIKSLDPRNNVSSNTEVQYLKSQLLEKDKIIKQLTKDNEKIRNSREQEEQLIASAWYKLGANLNRRATDERISTIGNSFLSQQRNLPASSLSSTSLNSSRRTITSQAISKLTNGQSNSSSS